MYATSLLACGREYCKVFMGRLVSRVKLRKPPLRVKNLQEREREREREREGEREGGREGGKEREREKNKHIIIIFDP